jgi:heme-degrading monooxygenase HmoA
MSADSAFAPALPVPHYAVIFSSQRTPGDDGYGAMAERMTTLASTQAGFLGIESVRSPEGFGITISYWSSPEAIRAWKDHADHIFAQETGVAQWYERYELRVARVERAYSGPIGQLHATMWDAGS